MPLLNTFLIGADPEFGVVSNGTLTLHSRMAQKPFAPWGFDHSYWVVEAHPRPERSVRGLLASLRVALNDYAVSAPAGRWVASPSLRTYAGRGISCGGHLHIDLPNCSPAQREALDSFSLHLEALDIFPKDQCADRRNIGYGATGDIRPSYKHFEYRTFPSWLFSQRAAKVTLIGGKLCAVRPTEAYDLLGSHRRASVQQLTAFFEAFREDDDVKWLLDSGVLKRRLAVNPDRDVREVWHVEPKEETPHWKESIRL